MRSFSSISAIFLLLAFMSGTENLVFAQQPSQEFLDIFERETTRVATNSRFANFKNIKTLSFFPDTLPGWFFRFPPSTADTIYAIGISDPDLPQNEALGQALSRARNMAILQSGARIEFFRDLFTTHRWEHGNSGHRQRFDTFLRASSSAKVHSDDVVLINQHFTRFGEAIVMVKYMASGSEPSELTQQISVRASLLFVEAQIGEIFEPQSSYEFYTRVEPSGDRVNSYLAVTRKGNREQTISETNRVEYVFPLFVYRYSNSTAPPFTRPLTGYSGLWALYARDFLEHLALSVQQSAIRLKNLEQQSQPEITTIAREVASFRANIFPYSLFFDATGIVFEMVVDEL